jgi:hypothetical protein
MSRRRSPLRLQSWIPSNFAWTAADGVFCLEVPVTDPDIVDFISLGECNVVAEKNAARMIAAIGDKSLHGQLAEAALNSAKLKPRGRRASTSTVVVAYCRGVFLLPGEQSLCVLVGRSKPIRLGSWISTALKAEADVLLLNHQSNVAEFEENIKCKRQKNEEFVRRNDVMKKFETVLDLPVMMEATYQRPVLTAEGLLPRLPRGATFPRTSSGVVDKITKSAVTAVAGSKVAPSRDGTYSGILLGPGRTKGQGIVSWEPHVGLPSYPEVRWAVQRRLPAALRSPRIEKPERPKFDTGFESIESSIQLDGFDEALEDLRLDDRDFRHRVDEVRKDLQNNGFDAIAWFQPYHVWTEETWGIYFDAEKLDDLAYSFLDDFNSHGVRSCHSLAAFLALGLTYAHEFFHARVEAALSWMELNALQPRHLRYKRPVYDVLRETRDWLEEALANWSARDWFRTEATQLMLRRLMIRRLVPHTDRLERVVESSLDLAPPGYRDWRLGDLPATWRTFATQLATGNPKLTSPGIGLPIESVLNGAPPYDLQQTDVPLRFKGQGVIADRLQSHPATFNVPVRRELEKALKHYRYELDESGGKGGHQKWTGPDKRAFILPTRDPVSRTVFKSFLDHFCIDKAIYVQKVRPAL